MVFLMLVSSRSECLSLSTAGGSGTGFLGAGADAGALGDGTGGVSCATTGTGLRPLASMNFSTSLKQVKATN